MKVRVLLCALIVSVFAPGLASAASPEVRIVRSSSSPIRLTVPAHVVEGVRYRLSVHVSSHPTLTPGMQNAVTIPLNKPYRLGVQVRDTSTGELWAEPAIGDAQLLCRGF